MTLPLKKAQTNSSPHHDVFFRWAMMAEPCSLARWPQRVELRSWVGSRLSGGIGGHGERRRTQRPARRCRTSQQVRSMMSGAPNLLRGARSSDEAAMVVPSEHSIGTQQPWWGLRSGEAGPSCPAVGPPRRWPLRPVASRPRRRSPRSAPF